jgi:hypothetical protein
MNAMSCASRHALKLNYRTLARLPLWKGSTRLELSANISRRCFHDGGKHALGGNTNVADTEYWKEYREACKYQMLAFELMLIHY